MTKAAPKLPPRPRLNAWLVGAYLAVAIYVPGLLLLWGAQRAEGVLKSLAGVGSAALFLVVLPVYFVYMTLAVRRFHPRGALRQLLPFVPVVLLAAAYLRPGFAPLRLLESWMLMSLPLFVGFMLALLVGLLALVARQPGKRTGTEIGLTAALLLLGLLPTAYVAAIGLQLDVLSRGADQAWATARFAGGIALVLFSQLGTVRRMYREGMM